MNSNIGRDIHAFVLDAMNACRGKAASAAGPPCKAPIILLFAGQMMPHTFSSITKPYAPPTPIEYNLLLGV